MKLHESGFTLIELMLALTVFGILAAVALPSYKQFMANTMIRTTAESIRNGIQVARAEAVKRNAVVTFTLAANTSWTVGCATVTATCPALIQSKAAREGSTSSITLGLVGTNTVSFTSLGTITPTVGQLSRVNVDNNSVSAADSKDLAITIGAGGNSRVCDPNILVVTDTRYCS